jgi:hypothetical protein
VELGITLYLDAKRSHKAVSRLVIAIEVLDVLRAAVRQQHPVTLLKLVALGVTAEVIVIVEDQNARSGHRFTKEPGRSALRPRR